MQDDATYETIEISKKLGRQKPRERKAEAKRREKSLHSSVTLQGQKKSKCETFATTSFTVSKTLLNKEANTELSSRTHFILISIDSRNKLNCNNKFLYFTPG